MIGFWGSASRDLFTILRSWFFDPSHHQPTAFKKVNAPMACQENKLRLLDQEAIPRVGRITSFKMRDTSVSLGSLPLIASESLPPIIERVTAEEARATITDCSAGEIELSPTNSEAGEE